MKDYDLEIISKLRTNGRVSLVSISHNIQVPVSTIYDKIYKLKKQDIIKKYTALLNFPKLGYNHHSILILKTKKDPELKEFLKNNPNINTIYEINQGFFIETLNKDLKQHLNFLEILKEKFEIEIQEHQCLEEIEKEKFLN